MSITFDESPLNGHFIDPNVEMCFIPATCRNSKYRHKICFWRNLGAMTVQVSRDWLGENLVQFVCRNCKESHSHVSKTCDIGYDI